MNKLTQGKLEKLLNKYWRDSNTWEVYTLKDRINTGYYDTSDCYVDEYYARKIHLGCPKLKKPKTTYVLKNKKESIVVPKLVYDYFNEITTIEKGK